ncbi:DNA-binding protein [Labilibaculum filiforme]|uniref:DNA-binding protein n=1 Tax=Labilibaculum filiforme TaxID=1940526 RepID=A0A2N3HWX1_9BACT|nr:ORF6N domain-containing protein [Labilibaculum filiforme]PKQ62527.1 DNA-binding protein [Labilibaculum filiforme]
MENDIIKSEIENRIFQFRGVQVMIDRDLAELYQVAVKRLNEQVKRNIARFPENFRFQLNAQEFEQLVANCDRFKSLKHSSSFPYVFTEQGISMLSAVLRSETAIQVSIRIMNAFVLMRKQIMNSSLTLQRLDRIEQKQVENEHKFERVFNALENKEKIPDHGIFFDGQVFDAYTFVSDLIRKAKKSIILIDNYVDDSVLTLLSKRNKQVEAIIYTQQINKQLQLDLKKHNTQYPEIKVKRLNKAHDRFLILDQKELYHIGASLKDLGKKWFAFSKMNAESMKIIEQLKNREVLGYGE